MSMYSLVMVTVKVSSPREQENLALQVSSVESLDAPPWFSPFAASDVGFGFEVGEFSVEECFGVSLCLLFWFAEPFF